MLVFKASTLEFLPETNALPTCYRNWVPSKWQNNLAFLVFIKGHLSNWNFEVAEKQQTVNKFVQQCWFFHSEAKSSKFADQADNIARFTNPFYFPKEKIT